MKFLQQAIIFALSATIVCSFPILRTTQRFQPTPLPAASATGKHDNFVVTKPTEHDIYTGRDPARVKIFDTTLRDGEQSPGCTMNTEEKLTVAKQLAKLGVDIIEAGFPVASPGDFEAVSRIASIVGNTENPPIICGLSRALKNDISVCYDAIKLAKFPRIHTFIATSDIHMEHKLKKTREQVLDITTEMVSHAASLCKDIEFSAEDALRSDPQFLVSTVYMHSYYPSFVLRTVLKKLLFANI
jgi:hypothetical protein